MTGNHQRVKYRPRSEAIGRQFTIPDYLVEKVGQRFPLTFTVEDACLTNSESIWVQAHFYL